MSNQNSQFQRASGCYTCRICDKRTRATGGGEESAELCLKCFEECNLENAHNDHGHPAKVEGCPVCT